MLSALLLGALLAPADLSAVGIVMSPRNGRSTALLRSAGRTRVVSVGEEAFGARVTAIEAGRVVLEFEGERREVPLAGVEARAAAALPPPPPPVPEDAATPARAMERKEVERRLGSEIPRILAETTLAPYNDGVNTGFTLARVPEGTLLSDAGIRPGDVLLQVNGTPVNNMATLIGLWPRLQNEPQIQALVLRNGQPVSLAITLR